MSGLFYLNRSKLRRIYTAWHFYHKQKLIPRFVFAVPSYAMIYNTFFSRHDFLLKLMAF